MNSLIKCVAVVGVRVVLNARFKSPRDSRVLFLRWSGAAATVCHQQHERNCDLYILLPAVARTHVGSPRD